MQMLFDAKRDQRCNRTAMQRIWRPGAAGAISWSEVLAITREQRAAGRRSLLGARIGCWPEV